MNSEKLIELVREKRELYDVSNSKYGDNRHKEKIWLGIAGKMNESVTTCKKAWVNLRDSYRRAVKKRSETTSGQSSRTRRKWKFEDKMYFLKPYFHERPTLTNVEINESSCVEEEDADQIEESPINAVVDSPPTPSGVLTHTDETKHKQKRKTSIRQKETSTSEDCASVAVLKYVLESKNEKKAEPHVVDAFVSGIAATLKTFSPYYLNVAKQKIFSIVNDLELEQIINPKGTPSQALSLHLRTHSNEEN